MAANVVTIGASVFTAAPARVFRRRAPKCNASAGRDHHGPQPRPQVGMGAGGNRKFLGQRRGDALVAPATGRRAILQQGPPKRPPRDLLAMEEEMMGGGVDNEEPAKGLLGAVWKFVRPHTIRGTLLGTTAIVTRQLLQNPELFNQALVPKALMGLLALLLGNGYIVGINQVYDVEIDKVNKPYLPLASGELSSGTAVAICTIFALLGGAIVATNFEPLITGLYAFGLFLGTLYSVPPMRLKRSPWAAFIIIAIVRGVLLNFGVHHATTAAIGLPFVWSPPIMFITTFVTVFAICISICKDLADIEGDKQEGIKTFATEIGAAGIAYLGSGLLVFNYCFAIGSAIIRQDWFNLPLMIGFHSLAILFCIWRTKIMEYQGFTKASVMKYYQNIWYLFYGEYLILPFL